MSDGANRKKRIAILGGGIGGLSTAFELTRTTALREEHEVTIYQMGWRLGGKCASGRGDNERIEEHGIHLFGGGYYNALGLMKECYDELNAHMGGWPLTFEQAFEKQYHSMRWYQPPDDTVPRATKLPSNALGPGDGTRFDSIYAMLCQMLETLDGIMANSGNPFGSLPLPLRWGLKLLKRLKYGDIDPMRALLTELRDELGKADPSEERLNDMFGRASEAVEALEPGSLLRLVARIFLAKEEVADVRNAYHLGNYLVGLLRGIAIDLFVKRQTFDSLDAHHFEDWLKSHGVSETTLPWGFAQAPAGILYAYPSGDPAQPDMGAGAYAHWVLRTFGYMGAPFWLFHGGTGEVIIAPLYEALKRRGVKFEFFHKVERLELDAAGKSVEKVHMRQQASIKAGPYEPLTRIGDHQCWGSTPPWQQLEQGSALKASNIDFESYWVDWSDKPEVTLMKETDYDKVVCAISLGALPYVCADLVAKSPSWRTMVDKIPTIATQTLQIWLDKSSKELGLPFDFPSTKESALGCGFAKPYDGLLDCYPLIELERWPKSDTPVSLWYFSDVIAGSAGEKLNFHQAGYPAQRRAEVRARSIYFLNTQLPRLLPKAVRDGQFDFGHLVTTGTPTLQGEARIDTQAYRANIEPSERYVTAPHGTTQHRIKAAESGFANLVVAGDWTYTGLNVGCVEATVMSGKLAANAIRGLSPSTGVIGYR